MGTTAVGTSPSGEAVYLKDIWPTRSEIQEVEKRVIVPALYNKVYGSITVKALAFKSSHTVIHVLLYIMMYTVMYML